jgi:hypothetical protein
MPASSTSNTVVTRRPLSTSSILRRISYPEHRESPLQTHLHLTIGSPWAHRQLASSALVPCGRVDCVQTIDLQIGEVITTFANRVRDRWEIDATQPRLHCQICQGFPTTQHCILTRLLFLDVSSTNSHHASHITHHSTDSSEVGT